MNLLHSQYFPSFKLTSHQTTFNIEMKMTNVLLLVEKRILLIMAPANFLKNKFGGIEQITSRFPRI